MAYLEENVSGGIRKAKKEVKKEKKEKKEDDGQRRCIDCDFCRCDYGRRCLRL